LAVRGPDGAPLDVDRLDLGLHEPVSREHGRDAERIGDRVRRQLAGRDLVKERGEEVIVLPIDERQLDALAGQTMLERADQVQSREAAADDDNTLALRAQFGLSAVASTRSSSAR